MCQIKRVNHSRPHHICTETRGYADYNVTLLSELEMFAGLSK
jgi:hypothetical protein